MVLPEIRDRALRLARPNEVVAAGALLISRSDMSEPDYQLSNPLFIFMAQGGKRLYLGERVIEYLAGECLIVTVGLPLSGHFIDATPARPALAVSMPLRPNAIAALLPELQVRRPVAAGVGNAIGTLTASAEVADAVVRLLRLQDTPEDALVLSPLVERELMWRLLTGPLGDSIAQLALPESSQVRIGKVIAWLRANLAEAVAVPELAAVAAMSESTFHRHFHSMTGMTPLQFRQHLRLQEARSLLVTGAQTVTGVAHAVGYTSPTQFSREYCRLFGLPPGRDAARLRGRA
jgi:AraC-like DNA-binding protein